MFLAGVHDGEIAVASENRDIDSVLYINVIGTKGTNRLDASQHN
mgnify:CR=1 FL=1